MVKKVICRPLFRTRIENQNPGSESRIRIQNPGSESEFGFRILIQIRNLNPESGFQKSEKMQILNEFGILSSFRPAMPKIGQKLYII